MSRIHEALKKAEQERAVAQASGTGAAALNPASTALLRANGAAPEVAGVDGVGSVVLSASNYLRFDDLKLHCAHPRWQLDPNINVFFDSDAGTAGAEQFRTLRSRLYQLRANGTQPLRTLLVTSAIPAEGKTFVANNLAQAIVRQADSRVLLIDTDLRRPRLHVSLGAPIAPGLSDYLRGETDEMAIIQHGQVGNLCFIAGGCEVTDPSELLSNWRLKSLLDRVTPVFDWVILDSPPCLPVADAGILADLCDGVLMVLQAGSTPSETAQRACQEFRERNLVGVVLNRAQRSAQYGRESYNYNYNQSRTDPESQNK
jgi:protein-tyrosine kinase